MGAAQVVGPAVRFVFSEVLKFLHDSILVLLTNAAPVEAAPVALELYQFLDEYQLKTCP